MSSRRWRRRRTDPRAVAAAAVAVLVLASGGGHGHHHGGGGAQPVTVAAGSVSANVALGQQLAAARGWTGSQWSCLDRLWNGESGWSATADTRVTGAGGDGPGSLVFAYGVAQARGHGPVINGVTAPYPVPAANPPDLGGQSDAGSQIRWGLGYIAANYGSPCGALSYKYGPGGGLGY
jgi:hypothetical protein